MSKENSKQIAVLDSQRYLVGYKRKVNRYVDLESHLSLPRPNKRNVGCQATLTIDVGQDNVNSILIDFNIV